MCVRWRRSSAGARRSPQRGCSIDRCSAAPTRPTYFISISSQEAGNNLQINCHFYKAAAAGCTPSAVKDDVEAQTLTVTLEFVFSSLIHLGGDVLLFFYFLIYASHHLFFQFTANFYLLNIGLLRVLLPIWFNFRHFLSENMCDLSLGMTSHHFWQQMQPSHLNSAVAGVQKNKKNYKIKHCSDRKPKEGRMEAKLEP